VSLHYLVKCRLFTDRAIGQWRRRLSASSSSKVDTLNVRCKNCRM